MLQKIKTYKILVEARDHGEPSLSSTATINIAISDSNTHAPVFNDTKVRICKTVVQGDPLQSVICCDQQSHSCPDSHPLQHDMSTVFDALFSKMTFQKYFQNSLYL